MQILNSYISQFFEISDNPLSYFFLFIIGAVMSLLIIAIYNKKIRKLLERFYLLEKDESPKHFLGWLVSIMIIIKLLQIILIQPFMVDGGSMLPNFTDRDIILVDKITYKLESPKRGDVVVFKFKQVGSSLDGKYFVKRLIALPGDNIIVNNGVTTIITKEGEVIKADESFVKFVDNKKNVNLTLPENKYFVMGDNRAGSYDSRAWGPVDFTQISGRAVVELFDNFSIFPQRHIENYSIK